MTAVLELAELGELGSGGGVQLTNINFIKAMREKNTSYIRKNVATCILENGKKLHPSSHLPDVTWFAFGWMVFQAFVFLGVFSQDFRYRTHLIRQPASSLVILTQFFSLQGPSASPLLLLRGRQESLRGCPVRRENRQPQQF